MSILVRGARSAVMDGALSGLSSLVHNHDRFRTGKISGAEYAARAAIDTGRGALATGARRAAAELLKEGGKAVGRRVGSAALRRAAGSSAATTVALGVVEAGCAVLQYASGAISGRECGRRTLAAAGGAAGGCGGVSAGAAIGTMLCPGIGTAAGALAGGIIGGMGGRRALGVIGDQLLGRPDPHAAPRGDARAQMPA